MVKSSLLVVISAGDSRGGVAAQRVAADRQTLILLQNVRRRLSFKIFSGRGLFAAILLLACFSAEAQNPAEYYEEIPRTFYGGLVAGANFAQVDGDNYAGYHKVGINAGGIVYANLADHLAASVEILFSQKGARSNGSQAVNGGFIQYYRVDFNYAEVPLMLNYFDKRKSHFGAGVAVNRLITVKESGEGQFSLPNPDFTRYPFRKMDFQFIIAGNLHLVKGLFLNARWQYSLASIRDKKFIPPNFAGRNQQFNNMWTVWLMYLF